MSTIEVKMWQKVVVALAGIEVQSQRATTKDELERDIRVFYERRVDSVVTNSCADISVGDSGSLVESFPTTISRELMMSVLDSKDLWRAWKEIRKVVMNDITPEFISLLNDE